MIEINEYFSESKRHGRLSEDRMIMTPHFCAVIDGSTSKIGPPAVDKPTTGWSVAEILKDTVLSLPKQTDINEAAEIFTSAIARYYEEHGTAEVVRRYAEKRLTASMVLYSECRNEIWMFGDCQFRYEGTTYLHPKRVDAVLSAVRAEILHYLLKKGHSVEELQADDLGRNFISGALCDQCSFQNVRESNPYSYSVLDGFPMPAVEAVSFNDTEEVEPASSRSFRTQGPTLIHLPENNRNCIQGKRASSRALLILSSDGYPLLADTLAETERLLAYIIDKDPLMIDIVPSTKGVENGATSFDDRTYLSFFI